ncbi:MAG: type II 3-dehydroquinate dehydratase [Spirochaetae bacterium HGW-Spirochaetae-6]|nr:MAG: type II 3-dehydroquinate dehydratase [Spirochaetae bacterium HGW-Spirochaetae-6]
MKILVVNGPNLNLLGTREPEKYGKTTLKTIEEELRAQVDGFELVLFQSNHEGALLDFLHKEGPRAAGMILNPGAFTHTSIALRDAILGVGIPFIEVHLTNVYKREEFRQVSYFKDIALGQIVGLGARGYSLALSALVEMLSKGEIR